MKRVMKIIDEENNEEEFEILCTFDSDLTNKSYVIYSGYYVDEDGTVLMQAGSYEDEGDYLKVDKRLTQEENEMIQSIMKKIIEEAEKRRDDNK